MAGNLIVALTHEFAESPYKTYQLAEMCKTGVLIIMGAPARSTTIHHPDWT